MTAAVSRLACTIIDVYQRHISPRKGYTCAFRALHGRESCSSFGKRAIARMGLMGGLQALRRRFRRCRLAMSVLDYQGPPAHPQEPHDKPARDTGGEGRLACCAADAGCSTCSACGH
jgi:putative component of membrane protein insertase Oxa1/YidC/SpoIIIJ protein YidD